MVKKFSISCLDYKEIVLRSEPNKKSINTFSIHHCKVRPLQDSKSGKLNIRIRKKETKLILHKSGMIYL